MTKSEELCPIDVGIAFNRYLFTIALNWVMGKPSLEKIRAQTEKPSEK